ncbi:hypothetical protein WJX81_004302 [Elliptochloris bilobata]|uniref:Mitochondrial inner membrane protease subunit 2 n=1 Tax=Elliptochloris bilobata TaxID=381761 RepID=A0AAW1RR75_9CHLO
MAGLRAAVIRARIAFEATVQHALEVNSANLAKVFWLAYRQPVCNIISITGDAMAPTLNAPAAEGQATVERLLMRLLRAPLLRLQSTGWEDSRSVYAGDVVAFQSPVSSATRSLLVRRVAAIEGQELVADDPQNTSYVLPAGHCWVLADNPALAPPHVIDSRSFGPLPASLICGRIVYSGRPTDHGPVKNSYEATDADKLVLAIELDVDEMTSKGDDEVAH